MVEVDFTGQRIVTAAPRLSCVPERKGTMGMASNQLSFRRISHSVKPRPKLTETYCPFCGNLIAASPHLTLLDFVERLHACPESRAFANTQPPNKGTTRNDS